MQYIGTSLGRCLRSILSGEVSVDDVLLICTRTLSHTKEDYLKVVLAYHTTWNGAYKLGTWPWSKVERLAIELWNNGKIHQPRNFGANPLFSADSDTIWIEIIPSSALGYTAVKDLYDQLRMTVRLCE
jgi:hypothetical protein